MSIKKISLCSFIIFTFIVWSYYFPYQRLRATSDFYKYIKDQGTDKSNIDSIRIFKNYKQDGYYINVIFKDDPDLSYDYKWYIKKRFDEHIVYNIFLIIYKNGTSTDLIPEIKPKYPPLHNSKSELI